MLSGRALALLILAWSLVRVVAERIFGRPRGGIARFRENYDPDRLEPRKPGERAQMKRFSACIACGRCDVGEAERVAASNGEYPGLMAVVLASTRSLPDSDAAARAFAHVPDAVLSAKEAICPTGVPFRALADFVRARAHQSPAGANRSEVGEA